MNRRILKKVSTLTAFSLIFATAFLLCNFYVFSNILSDIVDGLSKFSKASNFFNLIISICILVVPSVLINQKKSSTKKFTMIRGAFIITGIFYLISNIWFVDYLFNANGLSVSQFCEANGYLFNSTAWGINSIFGVVTNIVLAVLYFVLAKMAYTKYKDIYKVMLMITFVSAVFPFAEILITMNFDVPTIWIISIIVLFITNILLTKLYHFSMQDHNLWTTFLWRISSKRYNSKGKSHRRHSSSGDKSKWNPMDNVHGCNVIERDDHKITGDNRKGVTINDILRENEKKNSEE